MGDFIDEFTLPIETINALRDFALTQGIVQMDTVDRDLLGQLRNHFENPADRNEDFDAFFVLKDGRCINFTCHGWKRDLGQTLSSTGLTLWRATEHMSEFIVENQPLFENKTICELGAGLGYLAILIDKIGVSKKIVATDGDDDTLELLLSNIEKNQSTAQVSKLWWGQYDSFLEVNPERFDVVIGADIIYEESQIAPLIQTVNAILNDDGYFYLAFARRNVKMDTVLEVASSMEFEATVLEAFASGTEPIYSFSRCTRDVNHSSRTPFVALS